MAQFAVSRSTVREALRVLESSGLIRSRPGDPHGAEVLPYSVGSLHKSVLRLAKVDELTLGQLIQFRIILEGAGNQLAARLCTREQIAELEAALTRMRAAIDEGYSAFSEADVAFHDIVAEASGNKLIQVCGEVVRAVVVAMIEDKLAKAPDSAELMHESLRHHGEVLEAIRRGDGAEAARLERVSLYEYYVSCLTQDERPMLEALMDPDR
jgi:DNA-binding FadR family transcriptional regulator